MISHKHKFIFVHINKTGGTSIEVLLKKYSNKFKRHQSIIDLNKEASSNDYFKFTFARNSWDRFLSLYKYRIKTNQTNLGSNPIPFKEWAKHIYDKNPEYYNTPNKFKLLLLSDQLDWITDAKGSVNMDFIGRFEKLQEDFNIVCDKIGIPHPQLPHKNKSNHKHYTEYYDDETRQIVAEKFAKDIKYFDYEFGD
jgi:hypothetical protein